MHYPTIESFVGATPLIRLQRLGVGGGNTVLLKLEGNNPAGSVKDRPAISMIRRAEERGEALAAACHVDDDCWLLIESAAERFSLSARAHQRVLRVARTIADLVGSETITPPHVAEALSLRSLDRRY